MFDYCLSALFGKTFDYFFGLKLFLEKISSSLAWGLTRFILKMKRILVNDEAIYFLKERNSSLFWIKTACNDWKLHQKYFSLYDKSVYKTPISKFANVHLSWVFLCLLKILVPPQMFLQITWIKKWFRTKTTRHRVTLIMGRAHVSGQRLFLEKPFLTNLTDERFFIRML